MERWDSEISFSIKKLDICAEVFHHVHFFMNFLNIISSFLNCKGRREWERERLHLLNLFLLPFVL